MCSKNCKGSFIQIYRYTCIRGCVEQVHVPVWAEHSVGKKKLKLQQLVQLS